MSVPGSRNGGDCLDSDGRIEHGTSPGAVAGMAYPRGGGCRRMMRSVTMRKSEDWPGVPLSLRGDILAASSWAIREEAKEWTLTNLALSLLYTGQRAGPALWETHELRTDVHLGRRRQFRAVWQASPAPMTGEAVVASVAAAPDRWGCGETQSGESVCRLAHSK